MTDYRVGLVSISFRELLPSEIVTRAKRDGIDTIEWGGDVHVPHGDTKAAKEIRLTCARHGIEIAEYGSYYRLNDTAVSFDDVLASAKALGTDVVRIWGGSQSSDTLKSEQYDKLVRDARRVCDMANGINVCLECHKGTITDEYHTAIKFIKDVGRENLKTFWQPNQFRDFEYNVHSIKALSPYIVSAHVFAWDREKKMPLSEKAREWEVYVRLLKEAGVKNYMLEFMPDNNIDSLKGEAQTLKELLR